MLALALAFAACAVSSGLVQAQNSAQPPLEASSSLPLDMQHPQSIQPGLYPSLEITPHARPAATSTSGEIDWRAKGAVGPVENTGQCGSDWAFSAKSAAAAAHFLATGTLLNLSAQQFIDCGGSTGSQGCNGGLPEQGLLYIQKTGSAALNSAYTYTERDGACRKTAVVALKISRIDHSPVGDDAALFSMLETRGPVAVRLEDNWIEGYAGGIQSCASRTHSLASALLVGAIIHNGVPVWVVKFAKGTAWGASGYAYISRLHPNECGIADDAVVAVP
jgi:cathepsin L